MKKAQVNSNQKAQNIMAQRVKEGVLSSSDVEKVCNIFRVLADPTRMKIVLGLFRGDMCVNHLMEVCGGTQSGVSHQLRILRDNQIVKAKRIGQSVEYSIADAHVREIVEMGVAHLCCVTEDAEA